MLSSGMVTTEQTLGEMTVLSPDFGAEAAAMQIQRH